MCIAVLTVKLYTPWVHSLKEKRMEIKSLLAKLRNKFNVSVAETGEQDTHQTIVFTVAAVTANPMQANRTLDTILRYIEGNTEAEVFILGREVR